VSAIPEETKYLHIQGHLLTFTLMFPQEASTYRDHGVMPWLHLCRLDSAVTSDQTLLRRACFYPDHGRIGADTVASLPETGKALLIGKYRNNGQYAWEESFSFLALIQQLEEECYTRVGIILAFAYEPHSFEKPRETYRRFEEPHNHEKESNVPKRDAHPTSDMPEAGTEEAKQVALRNIDAIPRVFLNEMEPRQLETVRLS
jgi:hypothetical protein